MIVSREDIEQFKLKVESGFDVHDSAVGKGAVSFHVSPRYSHEESYEAVFKEFEGSDYVPFYRKTGEGLKVLIAPRKMKKRKARPIVHLALLILTAITVTWAGYEWWADGNIGQSIMFAAALMGILGIHELGHSLTARRREIEATLPFFIPAPPMIFPFGTLGAVIFMGSPVKDRNSLIDVGLSGPIAGFLICIPIAIIGLKLSTVAPLSIITEDEYIFTMPLILQLLSEYIFKGAIDSNMVIQPHPIAMAAWAGFFVTALNVLPMGQLDGGHVIRGLFPAHFRKIYYMMAFLLFVVGILFISPIWIFWVILIWLMTKLDHPGPLNDVSEMEPRKKIYGAVILLLLLVLCFTPAPVVPSELLSNV
ncbi:MAG: site-2 protease family protein [Candidatus Hydrothermarchaeaceae archaeon]